MRNRKMVSAISKMLDEYFGIVDLPRSFIEEILTDNFYDDEDPLSVTDTLVRDITIELVCDKLGVRPWPTYGERYPLDNFYSELSTALKAVGARLEQ